MAEQFVRDAAASDPSTASAFGPLPDGRTVSTATLLGQVMLLVSVTIGFLVLGAVIGRNLSGGAAVALSLVGFGMLLVQSLGGERFRTGRLALGWLFAVGLVLGLGLGPVLSHYAAADPAAITEAAGATALVVAATGAAGLAIGRDLSGWLRPLSFAILGIVLAALVLVLLGAAGSPALSLAIAGVSALLLIVDFNLLRRQATDDDVVVLATGIFVSVVNLFLSLLALFTND